MQGGAHSSCGAVLDEPRLVVDMSDLIKLEQAPAPEIPKDWDFEEFIMEGLCYGSPLKEYGHDEHRWYTMYSKVVKLGEVYIDFQTYTNSGDEPAFDGKEHFEMVMESACEVFPKEVTVTDYVPIEGSKE